MSKSVDPFPHQSRFQRLKNKICNAINRGNGNREPPPPYTERLLANMESTWEEDLKREDCRDEEKCAKCENRWNREKLQEEEKLLKEEKRLKEEKCQQAVEELRNMIRQRLMRRYLLIASPKVLLSLEDHPLKLSSTIQNVYPHTPQTLWPELYLFLQAGSLLYDQPNDLERVATWMQEYIVEPTKTLGLEEVAVRKLLRDVLGTVCSGGYPGEIGLSIFYGHWWSIDRRLVEDRRMLEVFRGAVAVEKATGKEKCLYAIMCAAFNRVKSIAEKKSV